MRFYATHIKIVVPLDWVCCGRLDKVDLRIQPLAVAFGKILWFLCSKWNLTPNGCASMCIECWIRPMILSIWCKVNSLPFSMSCYCIGMVYRKTVRSCWPAVPVCFWWVSYSLCFFVSSRIKQLFGFNFSFQSKYIKSASKLHNVFLTLFKRLNAPKTIALEPALIECLVEERECFKVWKMNYRKNIVESKQLLSYLGIRETFFFSKLFRPVNQSSPFFLYLLFQRETGQIYRLHWSKILI